MANTVPFTVTGNGYTLTTWSSLPAYSVITVVTKRGGLFSRNQEEKFYTLPGYSPMRCCPEEKAAVDAIINARIERNLVEYYAEAI